MSIGDLSGLAGGPPQATTSIDQSRGVVAKAPTALTDDIAVVVQGSSTAWPIQVRHGRWWPHPSGTLPLKGDPCLILRDHWTGEPWVLVGTP